VGVPALTGQRTDPNASPEEIDRAVREQLSTGNSLYTLDSELLSALRPDVILTQDMCSVCSIDLASVRKVAASLNPPPRILSLNPASLEDVLEDMLNVGEAMGLASQARNAVVTLRERLFRALDHVNPYEEGPPVAFLEWTSPLFIGGHWTPQLIERAGGRHPLNPATVGRTPRQGASVQTDVRSAGKSIQVSPEALVESAPEYIVVCPCGIGLDGVRAMTDTLARQPWWVRLPAARSGRVAIVDGSHMFNRPGPRLVEAQEWLVGWLQGHPELIRPDFPWQLWSR
jgi:ABC-type Fe3+-hydroxamate transport system substrate-binding protein